MLWLAAIVALAAPAPPNRPARPAVAQATATVTILSGVRLKLDADENADAPPARDAQVTVTPGVVRRARLIEFE